MCIVECDADAVKMEQREWNLFGFMTVIGRLCNFKKISHNKINGMCQTRNVGQFSYLWCLTPPLSVKPQHFFVNPPVMCNTHKLLCQVVSCVPLIEFKTVQQAWLHLEVFNELITEINEGVILSKANSWHFGHPSLEWCYFSVIHFRNCYCSPTSNRALHSCLKPLSSTILNGWKSVAIIFACCSSIILCLSGVRTGATKLNWLRSVLFCFCGKILAARGRWLGR